MPWLYLFIAASFEMCWTFSLKFMKLNQLKTLTFSNFYTSDVGLPVILPIVGYVVFGIGNIYFFSLAMKQIPTATAFTVWTAMAMTFIKLAEVFVFHQKVTLPEIGFLLLIMVGIIGLKVYSSPQ